MGLIIPLAGGAYPKEIIRSILTAALVTSVSKTSLFRWVGQFKEKLFIDFPASLILIPGLVTNPQNGLIIRMMTRKDINALCL